MKHEYVLAYGRVILRPLEMEDAEKMRILRNKNRRFFVCSEEITEEQQQQWYKTYLNRKNDYLFSVFYQEKWVGTVSLYDVDTEQSCAEFGRLMIDRDAAGIGGLGLDATQAACRIAFEDLGIHTVKLEVYEDNEAAKATYLKAGFAPVETFCDNSGQKMIRMELTQRDTSRVEAPARIGNASTNLMPQKDKTSTRLNFMQLLLYLLPSVCAAGFVCAVVLCAPFIRTKANEPFDVSAVVETDALNCGFVDAVNVRQLGSGIIQVDADGWGFDPFTNQLVTDVVVVANGGIIPSSVTWYDRSTVGEELNNPVLTTCGWKLTSSSTWLEAPAEISFYIVLTDGHYMELSHSPYHYTG